MPLDLPLPESRSLSLDHPVIMGILNVTPDSFSDGGQWARMEHAIGHGLEMVAEGADIIDVGGESTRPGSQRVDADEQKNRVVEVIRTLRRELDQLDRQVEISIDTTLGDVAETALDAGATILNDVSAGQEDPRLFELAATRNVPIVLMHMPGQPATMQQDPTYDNVVKDVRTFLTQRAKVAIGAGVRRDQIVIDPGIGFGKTREHNLSLLNHLEQFVSTGFPVILGTSRKRFMGWVCRQPDGTEPPPDQRVGATCATTALGVSGGVAMFRVHDVKANRQAADVAWAIAHS